MSDPQRIAIVVTDAVSANLLMRGQLEYLTGRGPRIEVVAGGSRAEQDRFRVRGIGPLHAVPFRRRPHPAWDLLALLSLMLLFARRRYSTIVYSTPKAMLLASLAAFVTFQPRRIALVRGRAYEQSTGLKRRIFLALDRLTFACSHQVIFISESLQAAYRRDGLSLGAKGRVLGHGSSNGVDLERFNMPSVAERRSARAALGLAESDFAVAVVGRVNADKGFEELLAVVRSLGDLKDLRFLVVGEVEDESLARRLAEAGTSVSIFPPDPAPERYFRAADLHLFLSHREGFGNVAVEAAAMGVPTFAFDVVGVRDSVADGITGKLFPFGNVAAVASAVRHAVTDRTGFRGSYPDARSLVAERFDQAEVWRRYADAFGVDAKGAE